MQHTADIAVYDADGQLTLVVETKSKLGTSTEDSTSMSPKKEQDVRKRLKFIKFLYR